ncbi:cell division protein FtsZ [Amylibacter sp. IMCC11727]|uniref:cell division protein FtsZ n=1 Tax=Amylibacter sp. IMCC11727 TaxID=3039851 RepID=UPI00244E203F|nr:cell division protein FtsZ [Amylibacter sp. IMCC11727]WGI21109.1 cell division protein FtsZ [Amylibacter sp. IMCC11727]
MTLNLRMPEMVDLKPRITVFGIGGAGGNAVNNMIDKALDGVDFVVANTDAQALQSAKATSKIQLGEKITEGLGAGARPAVGAAAAEESIEAIVDHLVGSHMCFITAGMGGGTGTGGAPIVAQAARELGILTVGVVTKPFQFEGSRRMRQATEGVEALQKVVDTLIIIPNQNLFRIANEQTTFTEAFSLADDVLYQGVKGVTDLMVRPGIINLDFADIRSVMDEMGKAMMGTGEASGEDRAIQAAEKAIANPLLDEISLQGARGVLINITGGSDLTLFELDEAANRIREEVDPEANIIVGSTMDPSLEAIMRVSVVATGIDAIEGAADIPVPRRSLKEPLPAGTELTAPVEEAAPAPVAEPVAAATPEAEPVAEVEAVAETVAEPSLFEAMTVETPAEPAPVAAELTTDDGLPAPAYQPQPAAVETVEATESFFDRQTEYAAAPAQAEVGQPSASTLARLDAAVSKAPRVEETRAETPKFFAGSAQAEKPKGFRLNSLISRMTGHGDTQETAHREQPPVSQSADMAEDQVDPEQERIEIPAFLRRQAN